MDNQRSTRSKGDAQFTITDDPEQLLRDRLALQEDDPYPDVNLEFPTDHLDEPTQVETETDLDTEQKIQTTEVD